MNFEQAQELAKDSSYGHAAVLIVRMEESPDRYLVVSEREYAQACMEGRITPAVLKERWYQGKCDALDGSFQELQGG